MPAFASRFLLITACLACGACANRSVKPPPSTAVGVALIVPAGAARMAMADNQAFQMAFPLHDPLPAYPEEWATGDREPISVCIDLHVDERGGIDNAQALYAQPECPLSAEALPPAFVSSALRSVREWRFTPAEICVFPPDVPVNPECSGRDVELQPVPIRFGLVFEFRIENGQATVASQRR